MNRHAIRTLLDLHEQILDQEDGYWVKIEAWEVKPSKDIPHGIRYSLTFDHKHRHIADTGIPYEFKDAYQLLTDFFAEVDLVLKEMRSS